MLTRTPPEALPHRLSRLSGPAAPEFAWQRLNEIAHELPSLFLEHWRESSLDHRPLEPNWDLYYAWDLNGTLRILTVRAEGALVGYLFMLLSAHVDHKTTLFAQAEKFWLDPAFRQGWTGVKLFKEGVRAATEWGAKEFAVPVELHVMDGRLATMLQRLKFRPVETIYSRKLG